MWTLEYNGTESSFAAWGFSQATAQAVFANMSADVFSVSVPGAAIDSTPVIPFEGAVIIRRDRTLAAGIWSGGAIEFSGKRLLHILEGRPEYEGITYQFAGPWYDLDATPFQQSTHIYTGNPNALAVQLLPEIVLFQWMDTGTGLLTKINSGQQLGYILQHLLDMCSAQSLAAPFQIGTIGVAVNLPTYQMRDVKCSEAIQVCLRCSPDAVVWFDYSTSPPTLNITKRADAVAYSTALPNKGLHLTPRYDLQPRAVVIYFKQTNQQNDYTWIQTTKQKYPTDGVEGGRRVIVESVDLQGWSRTDVTGSVEADTVANTRAFWSRYFPELQSTRIRAFSLDAMTVTDENGAAVSLTTYPRVLRDGSSLASWMRNPGDVPVVGTIATVEAVSHYALYDTEASGDPESSTNGNVTEVYPRRVLAVRVVLTNALTGNYTAVASAESAEEVPTGMAQSIYTSLAELQYAGSLPFVGTDVLTTVRMGMVVNITGGATAWATMKAQIQSIRKSYGAGRTDITIGPAKHLHAGDLTQMFLITRHRRVWMSPGTQSSAKLNANSTVIMGGKSPKENSTTGTPTRAQMMFLSDYGLGRKAVLHQDADNQAMRMHINNSGGSRDATFGYIEMLLADCNAKAIKLRAVAACEGGVAGYRIVLCSPFTAGALP